MFLLLFLINFGQSFQYYSIETPPNVTEFERLHQLVHVKTILGHTVFKTISNKRCNTPLCVEETPPGAFRDTIRWQKKRYFRKGESDPLYPSSWHLHRVDPSVIRIPSTGIESIAIAIVDDGLQINHPDIAPNYNASISHDFNGHDANPTPYSSDSHGTSAAGVCCAAQNNVCSRGIVHSGIELGGIRLIADGTYDYQEAEGLTYANNAIRIYSCSWGPEDSGMDMVEPGPVVKEALKRAFDSGQNIYVWAGGNGRQNLDNSNYDGYANSPYVLAIGAIDYYNHQSYYSESGSNLLAVTPSSGTSGHGIITVQPIGCTHDFGGTSSAAPLAAGIIARMLQVRPDLRIRDVQHIVARYAIRINPTDASWSVSNIRGYQHSESFGFGLMRLPELLAGTQNHTLVRHPVNRMSASGRSPNDNIPLAGTSDGIYTVTPPHAVSFIERVLVTVTMTHSRRGQVHVQLRSPYATSTLASHRRDVSSGTSTWTYTSLRHWGERIASGEQWQVIFWDDTNDGYRGTVGSVKVEWFYCE